MPGQTTEIRAKLRVEDGGSSSTINRIKDAFVGSDKAARQAAGGAVMFAKQAAAAAVGVSLGAMASQVKSTAMSWAAAAAGPAAMRRQMTAMNALLQDIPLEKARAEADATAASFRAIGMETGVSGSELKDAFQTLLETSKGTADEVTRAKTELGQLAKLSDVLGTSVESSAREVGFLHEGFLKARGPMFQLLNHTGIFGKDIRKASEMWQKMSEPERAKRVAYALDVVSQRVGKLPMTWERVTGQVNNLVSGWKKDFGEPLLEALIPEMQGLVEKLGYGRGEIKLLAKELGKDVGKWVKDAASMVEKGFAYIKDHQEDIRKAMSEGASQAKSVAEFVLAHKEELAMAYGVQKGAPMVMRAAAAAKSGIGFASSAATAAGIGGAVGTAATMALFATAVAAWALAVNEFAQLVHDAGGIAGLIHGESERNRSAQETYLRQMAAGKVSGHSAGNQLGHVTSSYLANVKNVGGDVAGAEALVKAARAAQRAADDEADAIQLAAMKATTYADALKKGIQSDQIVEGLAQSMATISGSFEKATAAQNAGQQKYLADLLLGSTSLQGAFLDAGKLTAEGYEALAKLVEGGSKDFAKSVREKGASSSRATAAPTQINMSGGQTFKLQQDFRDQDPDRVAYVFEEGIGKLVSQRVGSSTSTPFGT